MCWGVGKSVGVWVEMWGSVRKSCWGSNGRVYRASVEGVGKGVGETFRKISWSTLQYQHRSCSAVNCCSSKLITNASHSPHTFPNFSQHLPQHFFTLTCLTLLTPPSTLTLHTINCYNFKLITNAFLQLPLTDTPSNHFFTPPTLT